MKEMGRLMDSREKNWIGEEALERRSFKKKKQQKRALGAYKKKERKSTVQGSHVRPTS